MTMFVDDKTGMVCRGGTMDLYVIQEQRAYAPLELGPGDHVIDIGANIGAFAMVAAAQCKTVVCYEPESDNYAMLEANTDGDNDRVHLYRTAVVGDGQPSTVPIYINSLTNKGSHCLRPTRGREHVTVPAMGFRDVLRADPAATVLKVDIEGGEYDLPWEALRDTLISRAAVELHMQPPGWRDNARALKAWFVSNGWRQMTPTNITAKNWHVMGVWHRAP